jgi:DNA mismatch endonuclease (patch repair protein)
MSLPGRPDLVFQTEKLAVFVDGDFWHGYRFPAWRSRLSPYWKAKIERNRARDRRNFATLRRRGWHVLRIWEHAISNDLAACANRIEAALRRVRRSA